MAFSIYQASIPVFIHGLRNLSSFLGKAHADAQTRKIDFSVLINSPLPGRRTCSPCRVRFKLPRTW